MRNTFVYVCVCACVCVCVVHTERPRTIDSVWLQGMK